MKKVHAIRDDIKNRVEDTRQSLFNKISRGPLASLVTKGPLAKYGPKDPTKPDLQEVTYDFHTLSDYDLERTFQTSLTQGLTEVRAKELLLQNGPNALPPPETHYIKKVLGYLLGGFCWYFILFLFLFYSELAGISLKKTILRYFSVL